MKSSLLSPFFLSVSFLLVLDHAYAENTKNNSGADLLLKNGGGTQITSKMIVQQKTLNLDNAFLVQIYGSFRSLNITDAGARDVYNLVFQHDYKEALTGLNRINVKSEAEDKLKRATKLYLLYQLDYPQAFVTSWLEEANRYSFLNSELGVALDQIISNNASRWILDNGIYLSQIDISRLEKIAKQQSVFNNSLQAYHNMRAGENALEWIGKLKANDPIRYELIHTLVLTYARQGKLAQAGKIVKEALEPILQNETDIEKLSSYYMLLARLLYQAKAYPAAKQYYMAIPDESKQFLQARTEALWISMRGNDFSTILGELKSLELDVFADHFLPEIYLVNAMANLQQCQFLEVHHAFNKFVRQNKKFAAEIDRNIKAERPAVLDSKNLFVDMLVKGNIKLDQEISRLTDLDAGLTEQLTAKNQQLALSLSEELRQEWVNRQKILEATLRRMRFVKVEFLSTMRRLRGKLAQLKDRDAVKTINAATRKNDQVEFRFDNVLFADELFHLSSEVKNLCLAGKK